MDWVRGESIGRGGFSKVDLAVLRRGGCVGYPALMAVKSTGVCDSGFLENEKYVLDQLGGCPNIIGCYGLDHTVENNERLCNLLLEYAPTGSLAGLLKKSGGRFQESDVRRYTRSVIKGLCHVHAKGFAHCDIKLENLLVCEDGGEVKIADFGLAKKAGERQGKMEIRGTPLYMSPESVNQNVYDSSCDVWALGCAVVEMTSGKPAWNCKPGTHVGSLLIRIGVKDELPEVPEELSGEGKDFLSKCFVKDPAKRWTAQMLLEHPFVADTNGASGDDDTVSLKASKEFSGSPRCPFDFPEWRSVQSLQQSELWSEEQVSSSFRSSFPSCEWSLPAERLRELVCDQNCNWSDSDSWVTVR